MQKNELSSFICFYRKKKINEDACLLLSAWASCTLRIIICCLHFYFWYKHWFSIFLLYDLLNFWLLSQLHRINFSLWVSNAADVEFNLCGLLSSTASTHVEISLFFTLNLPQIDNKIIREKSCSFILTHLNFFCMLLKHTLA